MVAFVVDVRMLDDGSFVPCVASVVALDVTGDSRFVVDGAIIVKDIAS